jgi:hypothetical protein
VSQNNFDTHILFPANYLLMYIEIAQHTNGDIYGQKNIKLFTQPLIYMNNTFLLHFGVVKN